MFCRFPTNMDRILYSRSHLNRLIRINRDRIHNEIYDVENVNEALIDQQQNEVVPVAIDNELIGADDGSDVDLIDDIENFIEADNDGIEIDVDERLSNDDSGDDMDFIENDAEIFNYDDESDSNDSNDPIDLNDFNDDDIDGGDDPENGIIDEADGDDFGNVTLKQQLATWVRTHAVTCIATAQLLSILRESHPELPRSRPSLLRTPRRPIVLRTVEPGRYFHFGLKNCLRKCNFSFLQNIDIVEIDINIDGVSLAKSSNLNMWPILGAFSKYPDTSPFLIGCYEGYGHPKDIEVYLQEFVDELKDIMINGCEVTPQLIHKQLKIRLFCCDMPGRAFVKDVKGHSSLFGCDRCNQQCYHIGDTMVYQPFKGQERTDDTFTNRSHRSHHQPWSLVNRMLIEELQLGLVSQFVIDDMHAVHLGVARKMILCIFKGRCNSVYLTSEAKQLLDSKYMSYAPFIPSEFIRKPRSILKEISRWKAVEFRLFLLYTGVVLLRNSVGPNLYQHFLLLSNSIRFLSSTLTCEVNDNIIEQMLNKFVTDYPSIYDPKHLVYCVHVLLHLQEDVRRYGPIGSYSAYRFENHQRELKKHVKNPTKILQQMNNRIEEIEIINDVNVNIGYIGRARPRLINEDIFPGCNSSYRAFKFGSFILNSKIKDNCCLLNSNIPIEVQGFFDYEGESFIIAKKFVNPRNYYTEPFESMDFMGILLVDPPSDETFYFKTDDVKYKFMRLPDNEFFVLIPLLHHLD